MLDNVILDNVILNNVILDNVILNKDTLDIIFSFLSCYCHTCRLQMNQSNISHFIKRGFYYCSNECYMFV